VLDSAGGQSDRSREPGRVGTDGETIGHCPFCQRLFMVLLLKGVPFTLTTVDTKRSLDVLKDFAPGAQLPVLLYDGEPKTDTIRIEEFLEETLTRPEFPSLAPKYKESILAGNDIFHRFSAYIKNPIPAQDETLLHALLKAFRKLDQYLNTPLDYELVRDPELVISRRRFLDGDQMTLADCNLLPKLNIVNVRRPEGSRAPVLPLPSDYSGHPRASPGAQFPTTSPLGAPNVFKEGRASLPPHPPRSHNYPKAQHKQNLVSRESRPSSLGSS
uniref:Chloride intracellular channel 3 n=1 Tax=Naja naja TaxID=35670 RepID=A0A8C6XIL9_NAJNA